MALSCVVDNEVPLPKFQSHFTIGTAPFCTEVSVNTTLNGEKQLVVSGAKNPALGPSVTKGTTKSFVIIAKQPIESVTFKLVL